MRLTHRVHTVATPAQVWEVLGDPRRWPQFEPVLRSVRGAHGSATTGQRLVGLSRVASLGIPLDVLEAEEASRLVLLVHLVPGLRQEVTHLVTPAAHGGSDVVVSVVVDGPLARPAVVPSYLASGLTARLLARRTDQLARAARDAV